MITITVRSIIDTGILKTELLIPISYLCIAFIYVLKFRIQKAYTTKDTNVSLYLDTI